MWFADLGFRATQPRWPCDATRCNTPSFAGMHGGGVALVLAPFLPPFSHLHDRCQHVGQRLARQQHKLRVQRRGGLQQLAGGEEALFCRLQLGRGGLHAARAGSRAGICPVHGPVGDAARMHARLAGALRQVACKHTPVRQQRRVRLDDQSRLHSLRQKGERSSSNRSNRRIGRCRIRVACIGARRPPAAAPLALPPPSTSPAPYPRAAPGQWTRAVRCTPARTHAKVHGIP